MDVRPDKPAEESSPASASPPLSQSSANGPATVETPTTDNGGIDFVDESQQTRDYLKVNLLRDDPVETGDVGDAHERIADSITELIRTEKRGAAIALEGPYGSGKSTIVKMIEKRLRAENEREPKKREYHVFTFDAWHHENEALRLAFLHGLLDSFEKCGWIAQDQAKSLRIDLGKLDGSISETTTTRKPISSLKHAFGILSIAAAPLIWTSHEALAEMVKWYLTVETFPVQNSRVIAGLLGFGFASVGILLLLFEGTNRREAERQSTGKSSALTEKFAETLISGKTVIQEKTKVEGNGEVSSRNFELFYIKLLSLAMRQATSQRERVVLVVIDNLDRLNQDHATGVWSTLRVFIEGPSSPRNNDEESLRRRVWQLVPYDRDALFEKPQLSQDGDTSAQVPDQRNPQIDKLFCIRYHIPSSRQMIWRDFFRRSLERALPNWRSDYDDAADVVDLYLQSQKRSPVPRELIMIVNDIGALIKTCGSAAFTQENQRYFGLMTFATFVLIRRSGYSNEQVRRMIGEYNPLIWLSFPRTQRDRILAGIGCMTMGTMVLPEAQERRLDRDFVSALVNADRDQLVELIHLPCFWVWLRTKIHDIFGSSSVFDVWKSIDVLLNTPELKDFQVKQRKYLTLLVHQLLVSTGRKRGDQLKTAALSAMDLLGRSYSHIVERAILSCADEYTDADFDSIVEVIGYAERMAAIEIDKPVFIQEKPRFFVKLCYSLYSASERHRRVLSQLHTSRALDANALIYESVSLSDPSLAIQSLKSSGAWDAISRHIAPGVINDIHQLQGIPADPNVDQRRNVLRIARALRQIPLLETDATQLCDNMIYANGGYNVDYHMHPGPKIKPVLFLFIEALVYHCDRNRIDPKSERQDGVIKRLKDWAPFDKISLREWQVEIFAAEHPMLKSGYFTEALLNISYFKDEPLRRWIKSDSAQNYRNRTMRRDVFERCRGFLERCKGNQDLGDWIETLFKAHTPAPPSASSSATIASASPAIPPTPPPQPTEPPKTGP